MKQVILGLGTGVLFLLPNPLSGQRTDSFRGFSTLPSAAPAVSLSESVPSRHPYAHLAPSWELETRTHTLLSVPQARDKTRILLFSLAGAVVGGIAAHHIAKQPCSDNAEVESDICLIVSTGAGVAVGGFLGGVGASAIR
jgi:hypothetical protein